jgi:hypothetical protein
VTGTGKLGSLFNAAGAEARAMRKTVVLVGATADDHGLGG